ncbi:MAG TPA: hypothetical protein PLL33_06815, partial [Paracoccus sp. (in: a-proteobacteria)]|nr:hypothetical protein [Paracoccus sp. (in: a-proteobacteria)]
RREAIAAARAVWSRATDAEGSPVRDYLAHRAITRELLPAMPRCLRFLADCPYTVPDEERRGRWRVIHRGPAMIAAVQGPQGDLTAVHRTWIDLDRPSPTRWGAAPTCPPRRCWARRRAAPSG